MRRALTLLAALVVGAGPVSAQSSDPSADWDVIVDPSKKTTMAYTAFSSGLIVAFRCVDGSFSALLAGLPAAPRGRDNIELRIGLDGESAAPSRWNVTTDRTAAVADYPAAFARRLRLGGRLDVVVPNADAQGRSLRHQVDLPASSAAVEQVMTACGRPLVDPRDALLPVIGEAGLSPGLSWSRPPRPRFPMNSRYESGYVVLTCLATADGRAEDCVVESKHPTDEPFEKAVMAAIPGSRLSSETEAIGQITPRLIAFRVTFAMR